MDGRSLGNAVAGALWGAAVVALFVGCLGGVVLSKGCSVLSGYTLTVEKK